MGKHNLKKEEKKVQKPTTKKLSKKQLDAVRGGDDEVAALVIDNGSGMC